jgi:hypothetical protein
MGYGVLPQLKLKLQGTLKRDCLRPSVPLSVEEARQLVGRFVQHYNHVRLHSAIGYVTPANRLAGRQDAIFAARDQKLAAARERRAARRREQASSQDHAPHHACEKGTQRKASGVQGAAMSPLVARAGDVDPSHCPAEGETKPLSIIPNPLTAPTHNSISR